jgi:hypothetical protein
MNPQQSNHPDPKSTSSSISGGLLTNFFNEATSRIVPGLVVLALYAHKQIIAASVVFHDSSDDGSSTSGNIGPQPLKKQTNLYAAQLWQWFGSERSDSPPGFNQYRPKRVEAIRAMLHDEMNWVMFILCVTIVAGFYYFR